MMENFITSTSFMLLMIKLTLVLGMSLVLLVAFKRHSASVRHSILTLFLFGVPMLVGMHFLAPSWAIPGLEGMLELNPVTTVASTDLEASHPEADKPTLPLPPAEADRSNLTVETKTALATTESSKTALQSASNRSATASEIAATDGIDSRINTAKEVNEVIELPSETVSDSNKIFSFARMRFALMTFWLIGFLVLSTRIVLAWIYIKGIIRRSDDLDVDRATSKLSPAVLTLLIRISGEGIEIKVAHSDRQAPLGVGLIRKTILLPSNCLEWSENQWRSVALHEYAHFRRRDCLINLLARIQQAVLWFHPLAWIFVNQIRSESEKACDDFVIQSGVSNVDYADVLFHVASQSVYMKYGRLATVAMSDSSPLETRIQSILNSNTIRQPVKPLTLGLVAMILLAFSIPVATAQLFSGKLAEPEIEAPADASLNESEVPIEQPASETVTNTEQPKTTLHFFVTLKDDTTFVGRSSAEIEVDSAFGRSFFDFEQIQLIKSMKDKPGQFKIEATDGSTVFGKIKKAELSFTSATGDIDVKLEDVKSAALVGRSGLVAEKIADGFGKNKVTYHIRAPKNYDPSKPYPAIVLLHGADSNSKDLVDKAAAKWSRLADKYLLIGINGERRSEESDNGNPAFNYTYVNFVGASKYKGFPGTHRESPALVAEIIEEIRDYVPISTLFLGGTSEGGWLTYSMYMNYPHLIDGAFPIAGAMVIQCEPEAYDNITVRQQQRDTPIVILHPADDKSLDQIYSQVAYQRLLDDGFPMLNMLNRNADGDGLAGDDFYKAILWLESMAVRSRQEIEQNVMHLVGQNRQRDAIGLVSRMDWSGVSDAERKAILRRADFGVPAKRVPEFERLIDANLNNEWIDEFLEFRKTFEFAPAANSVMEKFAALRKLHDASAEKIYSEARSLKQTRNDDQAYAKYQEIVDKYYASKRYGYAKRNLAERAAELKAAESKNE